MLHEREFTKETFKRPKGSELDIGYIREHGLNEPILIEDSTDFGLTIPESLTIDDIVELVGDFSFSFLFLK